MTPSPATARTSPLSPAVPACPYTRGQVVLVEFPYADLPGSKRRPALVVSSEYLRGRTRDVLLVMITSNTSHAGHWATQVLVRQSSEAGQRSGLIMDSVVRCERIMTLASGLVQRVVGSLPDDVMWRVDEGLRVALSLPAEVQPQ